MSKVRNKNTDLEQLVCSKLRRSRIKFKTHVKDLPGTPDIVVTGSKIAVFVDGDFWHGYRFPSWETSVSPFWRSKILKNRNRDLRNFRRIRRMGWRVIRLWQHQLKEDSNFYIEKILNLIEKPVVSRKKYA